jgi:hypothetical protein
VIFADAKRKVQITFIMKRLTDNTDSIDEFRKLDGFATLTLSKKVSVENLKIQFHLL